MQRPFNRRPPGGKTPSSRLKVLRIPGAVLAFLVLLWIFLAPEFIWSRPWAFVAPFNELSDKVEASSSPVGDFVVFARDDKERGSELFASYREGEEWLEPVALTSINSPFNETDPDLSVDGQFLFFASDRPGGAGGFDLWVARRLNQRWGPPINLGKQVNSRFDEMGPSAPMSTDFMVFSSNRPRTPLTDEDALLPDKDLRRKYPDRDMDIFRAPWSGFRQGVRPTSYALRDFRQLDEALVERLGGSAGTEAAVLRSLAWIVSRQEDDGHWSNAKHGGQANHKVAATSLSLLCLLGRGFTHTDEGPYKEAVGKGVGWLVGAMLKDGDLRNGNHQNGMYDQGMATMALAEAYGLSGDETLRAPLQRAVDFIVKAQNHKDGGWRYKPGQTGDTSVFGWQIMALQSAQSLGLTVPDLAINDARRWLGKVSGGRNMGLYGYQNPTTAAAMTAEGMFCAQLLGFPRADARMFESAEYLNRMSMSPKDGSFFYYVYYATLGLYHHHGDTWDTWNRLLKEQLLTSQIKQGDLKGTWKPKGSHGSAMGKLTTTALATLALEVYYRYLPRYEYLHPVSLGEAALEGAENAREVPPSTGEPLPATTDGGTNVLLDTALTIPDVQAAVRLERVNTVNAEAQPALAPDGRTLVFASNRPGTRGGADLFVSHARRHGFSRPHRLKGYLNSIADETDPFLFGDGARIMFSSNRESPSGQWYRLYEAERLPFSLRRALIEALLYALVLLERVKWWLLAAILAALTIFYILRHMTDADARRKMTLLHLCLLASLLIHLIGLVFAAFYKISSEVRVVMTEGTMEVAVDVNALAQEKLALDIREDITELPDAQNETIAQQAEMPELESEAAQSELAPPELSAEAVTESFDIQAPAAILEVLPEILEVPLPESMDELAPLEAMSFEMVMEEQDSSEAASEQAQDAIADSGESAAKAEADLAAQSVAEPLEHPDIERAPPDPTPIPDKEVAHQESYHDDNMMGIQRNFTNAAHVAFSSMALLEQEPDLPVEAVAENTAEERSGAEAVVKSQHAVDVLSRPIPEDIRSIEGPAAIDTSTAALAASAQEALSDAPPLASAPPIRLEQPTRTETALQMELSQRHDGHVSEASEGVTDSGLAPLQQDMATNDKFLPKTVAQDDVQAQLADTPAPASDSVTTMKAQPAEAHAAPVTMASAAPPAVVASAQRSPNVIMELPASRPIVDSKTAEKATATGLARLQKVAESTPVKVPGPSPSTHTAAVPLGDAATAQASQAVTVNAQRQEARAHMPAIASAAPAAVAAPVHDPRRVPMESSSAAEATRLEPSQDLARAGQTRVAKVASSLEASASAPSEHSTISALQGDSQSVTRAQLPSRRVESDAHDTTLATLSVAAEAAPSVSPPGLSLTMPMQNAGQVSATPTEAQIVGAGVTSAKLPRETLSLSEGRAASAAAAQVSTSVRSRPSPAVRVRRAESLSAEANVLSVAQVPMAVAARFDVPTVLEAGMPSAHTRVTVAPATEPRSLGSRSSRREDRSPVMPHNNRPVASLLASPAVDVRVSTAASYRDAGVRPHESVAQVSQPRFAMTVSPQPTPLPSHGLAMESRTTARRPLQGRSVPQQGAVSRAGVASAMTMPYRIRGGKGPVRQDVLSHVVVQRPGSAAGASVKANATESRMAQKAGIWNVAFVSATERVQRPGMVMDELSESVSPYILRDAADRALVLKRTGGDEKTEAAVRRALDWMQDVQEADGSWLMARHGGEVGHEAGATGLALLSYMGWGARHTEAGPYQDSVARGLSWLTSRMQANGDLRDKQSANAMYSQAIATLAITEAYGLTRDPGLKAAAQSAINFVVECQNPDDGGWRYYPKEPGDTSVFGWQFMALKSAGNAGLRVPEKTMRLCAQWLSRVGGGEHGGLYGYRDRNPLPSLVSIGLFSRQLMGAERDDPRSLESVAYLRGIKPDLANARLPIFYQMYYTTLALYQQQGPEWDAWNAALKKELLSAQEGDGDLAGSWAPRGLYADRAGRVVSTAMAAMTLEVYYRYLPRYGNVAPAPE